MTAEPFEAIVLAGGSATRMGGVDKPSIEVGGRTMLRTALDAVAGAARIVVVGPYREDLDPSVRQTQESPRGSGPVAALAAGLRSVGEGSLVVALAADLPFLAPSTIERLLDALAADPAADAAFAMDDSGRVQFLLGVWRRPALTARLDALGPDGAVNRAMKSVVPKNHVTVSMSGISDCDTETDVAAARARAAEPVTIAQARQAIRDGVPALPVRVLAPTAALGAVLAEPLVAAAPLPRFDVSAMDGYAVSGPGPWELDTAIRYAGSEEDLALAPGHAVRIATGAHVPPGSTSVVRDEHVERTGTSLSRRADAPIRDDTRRSGEDWQAGTPLAAVGTRVTPAAASVALSGEVARLAVRGPVRAHVVVTGDEIRRDGPLREGQTRDSLGPLLPQFLSWCGVRTATESHLRDTAGGFDELLARPAAGTDAELIVIVGATGGGAADHMRLALQRRGARTIVGRVLVRPGGSQIVAALPDGRIVLGLPGNPYAAVATLLLTAPTVVAAMTGEPSPVPTTGVVANATQACSDFPRVVPLALLPDGRWHAAGHVRTAHLAALVGAQALAIIEPGTPDGGRAELLPLPR
ncbi:NTP transferase domain-containing protein [Rhodococcus sp. NPDC127528]|uniref:NTP transferase domain-containing protein n=1 Tax=unclassified Rhodococcus (in: high G+C Gram-positive bacteria) TaxID=192944 RepID=UPI003637269C